jgi:hypothetical protein
VCSAGVGQTGVLSLRPSPHTAALAEPEPRIRSQPSGSFFLTPRFAASGAVTACHSEQPPQVGRIGPTGRITSPSSTRGGWPAFALFLFCGKRLPFVLWPRATRVDTTDPRGRKRGSPPRAVFVVAVAASNGFQIAGGRGLRLAVVNTVRYSVTGYSALPWTC